MVFYWHRTNGGDKIEVEVPSLFLDGLRKLSCMDDRALIGLLKLLLRGRNHETQNRRISFWEYRRFFPTNPQNRIFSLKLIQYSVPEKRVAGISC
jgi:hypothetical protein